MAKQQLLNGDRAQALTSDRRIISVDVIRGLAMICIVRAKELVQALSSMGKGGPTAIIAQQLQHSAWEGFTFYDLMFPLFIFVVGISLVFSLDTVIATYGRKAALKRICYRTAILFLVGILYNGGFDWQPISSIRLMGVLQRIALCYCFAGIIYCTCKLRTMIVLCCVFLFGYWLVMAFPSMNGVAPTSFQEGANVADYFDRRFLLGSRWMDDHDPEGLLSTIPAVASCLLGVFAGVILKANNNSKLKKVSHCAIIGVSAVVAGLCWSLAFPIIKELWTSSYVLVSGGLSFIVLAVFYWIIDVLQYRRWSEPLVWVGRNAIAIYVASRIIDIMKIARAFVGGDIKDFLNRVVSQGCGDLVVALVALALTVLLGSFLYRKKIFITI